MATPLVWYRIPDIILRPAESRGGMRQAFYNVRDYLQYPVGVRGRLGEHPGVSAVLDKGDLFPFNRTSLESKLRHYDVQ